MDMRGLSVFISEIRKCTTKEQEQKRVDKELAKVRSKFKTPNMKGYDRKKYICKLLYIYMLGYEIDFGHIEAVNLLSSEKYSEKHMGYLACTLLLNENHELVTLITNCMKRDLNNKNSYDEQCLALTAIANIGGKEQAEALAQDVQKLLVSADTRLIVRKKASLTLLNMYRKYPELLPPDQWNNRIMSLLTSHKDLGVLTSIMSLLLGFVAADPAPYTEAVSKVIRLVTKLNNIREVPPNYLYYGIAAPWLQVKCLRLLQYYEPPEDQQLMTAISAVIQRAFSAADKAKQMDKSKSVSRTNAAHSVLFEGLNVLIHYDTDEQQLANAANLLGRYLQDKDPNLRYLALDTMSRLAYTQNREVKTAIRKHQMTVLLALKDPDISIRRRALDLLFSMCNGQNASQIVGELLEYLPLSSYEIREELVLKIAILAEKFASDFTWYVDVILTLIAQAGDFVSEEIIFRVVQIVTNRGEALQKDTAQRVFRAISTPAAHENAIKVAGYILGEFGNMIAGVEEFGPLKQFELLNSKFDTVNTPTKAMLLNTYIKFYNQYQNSELRNKVKQVFETFRGFIDAEMQQRANEYYNLTGTELMKAVLATLPAFPERESSLMKRIVDRQKGSRAVTVGEKGAEEQGAEEEQEGESAAPVPIPTDETPAPEQKPSNGGLLELDDLLGGGSTAPTTTAPVPTPAVDPFFTGPTNIASAAATLGEQKRMAREQAGVSVDQMVNANKPAEGEVNQAVQQDAEKKFSTLIVSNNGTAIEDNNLVVRVQSEFHGSKGRLLLQFANKTDQTITKVRAEMTTTVPQVELQCSQVAPLIAPRTQIQQYISIVALTPFDGIPVLSLYFEHEKKTYKFQIKLPVVAHKFVEPFDIPSAPVFFQKWNAIEKGSPQEQKDIVKPTQTVSVEKCKTLIQNGFKCALVSGVDQNPNNLVAAGNFNCQSGQHYVLIRLESNTDLNAYRVTIRSTNAIVCQAFFSLLKQQLAEL